MGGLEVLRVARAAPATPGSEACGGGGAVELSCGNGGGDAEFGGGCGDRDRANGEVGLAVDVEIWRDERLVVGSDFGLMRSVCDAWIKLCGGRVSAAARSERARTSAFSAISDA